MGIEKPYLDIPGTTVFDADQARKGYWLNQFCMSLMDADNRERFRRDEAAYLAEWDMTDEQRQAVLDRDMNRMIALGGNIYFLAKIGATDGKSFQRMAAEMTGVSEEEYRAMMIAGGRSPDGNRYTSEWEARGLPMSARVTGSVYSSHVPAIGVAIDQGNTADPYWQPLFAGYEPSKAWFADHVPDAIVLVYNDHATAFSLDIIPTFAIGTAPSFAVADEGWGPRPVPTVDGHPDARRAPRAVDHPARLRPHDRQPAWTSTTASPCRCRCCSGSRRPGRARSIPIAVNVVQYPVPSGRRCLQLGQAIRGGDRVLRRRPRRADLGHRRHEPPAAGPARGADQQRVRPGVPRPLIDDPAELAADAARRVPARGRLARASSW